jgi:NADH:ubiquinone oxidoreductase subunit 5 (subunit L)/multisubunit Na+/H+ antiporter MnhA subunit
VLMFLVCTQADRLLSLDFRDLTKTPSWYALILIGFIKETTVPFLLCFVVYRMIIQFSSKAPRSSWKRLVLGELAMALCTLLPLFLYLFYRVYFGNPRTFDFAPANLLNLQAISITLLSHLEQFGLAYLLFIAGIVLLFRARQHRQAVFLLLILVCVPVFHLLDTVKYAGYSRFNLFVLPAVLAGAAVFLRFLSTKKKWYLPALAGLMIAANLAITPVNLDGTKNPAWGYPGESYYPFPEALSWLKDHHRPSRIVFAGMSVDYYFDFYFDRLGWHPQYQRVGDLRADDAASLQDTLQTASERGSTCVVVLAGENPAPPPPQLLGAAGKWELTVFRNMAYSLFVYTLE